MSRGEHLVAIETPSRQAHQVRRVQSRMFRVDRDEELDGVISRHRIEERSGDVEVQERPFELGLMKRQQPVLPVQDMQSPVGLLDLQTADRRIRTTRFELQTTIRYQQHRSGYRRKGVELRAEL